MSDFAYPHTERNDDDTYWLTHQGLTKRELFAAMAMQGMLSQNSTSNFMHLRAKLAVEAADALLAELAKDGAP